MHKVHRGDFIQMLARVEAGRSKKSFIEQAACYVFSDGYCITFNDEMCCRTKSGLEVDFQATVHGDQLQETLENMLDEKVELELASGELRIHGNRKKAGIRVEAQLGLAAQCVEPPDSWTALEKPDEFSEAVKQVCGVAGTNEDEFMTVCVHIAGEYLEATDRQQAVRYDIQTGVSQEFLVRAKSLAHVAQFGVTKVGETLNWVHFRNAQVIVSVRRYLETYANLESIWAFRGTAVNLPRGAESAAKLGKVFAAENKEDPKVDVFLTDAGMRVRGAGSRGWAEAKLEMSYSGTPLTFRINPDTLESLVQNHAVCEIGDSKLMVRGERWKFVSVLGKSDS